MNWLCTMSSSMLDLIDKLLASLPEIQGVDAEEIENVKDDLEMVQEQLKTDNPKKNRIGKALVGIKKFAGDFSMKLAVTLAAGAVTGADWGMLLQQLENFIRLKTNIFIGNVIIRNSEWGNKFVENLSKDMKMRFPSAKGYSVRNLKYMKKFAQTFTEDDVDEYGLGRITWSHHQILMSKVSNREEYIWYLEKTLEHKWSVDDLTSQVKSQLYERQAVANKISNFERRLPAEQKNMVLSTMKDPYMFDFIDYTEEMLETDIENELVKNVTSLLMELGTGFAFMGQQYHLEVGEKDFYIDLLFYNTKLRCYVAIDLKTGEFKPEQAGKMNFYLSALDDLVKAPEDNPSVGLILCRDENRTIAEYALRDMSKPIGVSEYHLCTDLPLDLKNALPAVEDIRSRIDMKK